MNYKHTLSKTDFILYLRCPESLWLKKNKPDQYPDGEVSLFLDKIIQEGFEVEEYTAMLFPDAVNIPEDEDPAYTQEILQTEEQYYLQPSFITPKGHFARIDVLELLPNGSFHIYEVKSATSIKTDKKHNHLKDACFQKFVMETAGHEVSKVSIIHLNKNYKKQQEINPAQLLEIEDVTEQIEELYSSVVNDLNAAANFIKKPEIDESSCSCTTKTKNNHCDSFSYFNPNLPEHNIYQLNRISAKKIQELLDLGCTALEDVPNNIDLNTKHQAHIASLRQNAPIINKPAIAQTLNKLNFPLHFFDYETYASAIPKVDGVGPHQQLVFQVSMHTLKENGEVSHYEWLGSEMALPKKMLQEMQEITGQNGTFISWNAPFESGRNKEMMELLPEYANYLLYINNHMFDLMDVFKTDYTDYRFQGSTSIKKVLPVLCPEFSYDDLEVKDGTMAMDTWGRMILDPNFPDDIPTTRQNLLDYCKLDSLAMLEIYRYLQKL